MRAGLLFLALPSAVVLILLFLHSIENRGMKPSLAYFGAAFAYGWIRGAWIESLSRKEYGSLAPYVINLPVVKLGAASLQEVIGWSVAVTLAWLIADRLLRRIHVQASPYRVVALASVVLGSMCLAVEMAAIESGWWTWTIKQDQHPFFGRVPLVGLLDWSFVAIDFLLPYLAFAGRAPLATRMASLTLFPLHFYFHPKVAPLPEPVSLAWNDLAHAAIFTLVLLLAAGKSGKSVLPQPEEEKRRWIPPLCVLIIVGATAAADTIVANRPAGAFASLPLLLLGTAAFALPSDSLGRASLRNLRQARPPSRRGAMVASGTGTGVRDQARGFSWTLAGSRIGIVVAVFSLVYALRAPFHRHTRIFTDSMQKAVALVNLGKIGAAEKEVRSGLEARPDQAGGHAFLAELLLLERRASEARAELTKALDLNPTHDSALILLTTLDLEESRWSQAAARAAYGKRLYPDRPEFIYQSAVAARHSPGPVVEALAAARRGGPAMVQSLRSIAARLNDQATVRQLR